MATHFSILAWRIPWTEETGGLQFMESQRVDMTERLTQTCILPGATLVLCAGCGTQRIHRLFRFTQRTGKGKLRQRAGPRAEIPTQDRQALNYFLFPVNVTPPWLCDTQSPQMPFQILPPDL